MNPPVAGGPHDPLAPCCAPAFARAYRSDGQPRISRVTDLLQPADERRHSRNSVVERREDVGDRVDDVVELIDDSAARGKDDGLDAVPGVSRGRFNLIPVQNQLDNRGNEQRDAERRNRFCGDDLVQ